MSTEREEMRNVFFESWRKHQNQLPIEPLEAQLIDIMLLHPEYHSLLAQAEDFKSEDFPEENPFLHMSLHLAIREQVGTNRPLGIKEIYQKLLTKFQDQHTAEHHMMDCLAAILWEAQQSGKIPDEQFYLEKLLSL